MLILYINEEGSLAIFFCFWLNGHDTFHFSNNEMTRFL